MGRRLFAWDRRSVCSGRANVAIAVAESARCRINEVAAVCRAVGLEHTLTLSEVGVLLGSVERQNLSILGAVPGVLAVEIERELPLQGFRRRRDDPR